MAKRIRVRCPVCGMLVTQNRLDEDYDFEFIIQEIGSKGRGGIYHVYRKPDKVEGDALHYFKITLAGKLHQIADRLLGEARADIFKAKEAEVVEEGVPDYDTDGYEEVIPSAELSSAIDDEELIPSPELSSVVDDDEPVITELIAGGEEEWQGSRDLSPETILEG